MNALTILLALAAGIGISLFVPNTGAPAVVLCAVLASFAGILVYRVGEDSKKFLLQIFVLGLLVRALIGAATFAFNLQNFFSPDAFFFDEGGYTLLLIWQGELHHSAINELMAHASSYWGMLYMVAAIYAVIGRNVLAVQFVSAVAGAATAPAIFLCARHIFQNVRVARLSAYFVAFFPSLVLWSSQALKDGMIVFCLAVIMLATLKLGEKWSIKYFVVLLCALLGVFGLRFYIFYMVVAAIGGTFIIGMRAVTSQSLLRQFIIVAGLGLAMTFLGVLRTASTQLEAYGSLEAVQRNRSYIATSGRAGFNADADVSTTTGAISAIPVGLLYLLFAPFPWQLTNLRQSISLPEMLIWWSLFPLLVLGLWFTLKYRLRQALPILMFTGMLTLAYSIYQGNIGTAYRQRAQLLVFYFIFVAVGSVLLKERAENNKAQAANAKSLPAGRTALSWRAAAHKPRNV